MLAVRHLSGAQDWKGFKVAVFQHSSEKVEFAVYCHCLRQPPPVLFQTNTDDNDQAVENKTRFADHLTREFVQDDGCVSDILFFGGRTSLTDTTHSNAEGTRQTLALRALGTSWGQLLGHQDGIATAPGRNAWRHLPSGGCSTERPEHNGRKKETKA